MTASFIVALQGPLDLVACLEPFRRSGDDLLDRWDGETLVRTASTAAGGAFAYAARIVGSVAEPAVELVVDEPRDRPAAAQAMAGSIIPATAAFMALCKVDPFVRRLETARPGVRPVLQTDLLTALVRGISAQQVNLRWAATTRRRLAELVGERLTAGGHDVWRLGAARLAAVSVSDLRALQFTTGKAEALRLVGSEIASGRLSLAELRTSPDADVVARLTRLKGIGPWSADWILARTLGRPRVVAGDLGVRKAVGIAYLGGGLPDEASVRLATSHWGEAAGVAQAVLLHALASGTLAA